MKRACLILIAIAAFVVLLMYPSTQPYAANPQISGVNGGPTVVQPNDPPPIVTTDNSGNDTDDGDSDDLAGYRNQLGSLNRTGTFGDSARLYVNLWWKFLVWIR